jgi:hypothetical protein
MTEMEVSNNTEYKELIKHLQGYRRVVINTCYGGFLLSYQARLLYLELAGIPYTLKPQQDRDSQTRYGSMILVNDQHWDEHKIKRDDAALVSVIDRLGSAANGLHAKLKIVEIPPDVAWDIAEYDGKEWVEEQHRTWA